MLPCEVMWFEAEERRRLRPRWVSVSISMSMVSEDGCVCVWRKVAGRGFGREGGRSVRDAMMGFLGFGEVRRDEVVWFLQDRKVWKSVVLVLVERFCDLGLMRPMVI